MLDPLVPKTLFQQRYAKIAVLVLLAIGIALFVWLWQQKPPPMPQSIKEESQQIFSPLEENIKEIPGMVGEEGANFTEAEIQDIRTTWLSTTLGLSELLAGAEIEDAATFQGVKEAIQSFNEGRRLVAVGNLGGAVKEYEKAFAQARTARENGVPGPELRLPFQLVVAPDFIATQAGKDPEFAVLAIGEIGPVEIGVSGQPPEVRTEITVPTAGVAAFGLKVVIGDLAVGSYVLKIVANDGSKEASKDLTLVISEPR